MFLKTFKVDFLQLVWITLLDEPFNLPDSY